MFYTIRKTLLMQLILEVPVKEAIDFINKIQIRIQ